MSHKRVRSILLAVLFIGGLLPSVSFRIPASHSGTHGVSFLSLTRLDLPSLTSTPTPTVAFTPTATPLQPIPPTPTRTPTHIPTNTAVPPSPTLPPPPTEIPLPRTALVEGIFGYYQLLPLSCESRSAADWARHFEIEIHELDFYGQLPKSANPEEGFVGSVNGSWGQVPPAAYGVHAAPVARLLRAYGARAADMRDMSFEALKQELASGQPVIVWVTGRVTPGKGRPYEIDGQTITVAPYEHTVIAIGYDEENDRVTFLDGKDVYWRSYETFFESWGALGNLAVIWED